MFRDRRLKWKDGKMIMNYEYVCIWSGYFKALPTYSEEKGKITKCKINRKHGLDLK
jgi:hypothetical protein